MYVANLCLFAVWLITSVSTDISIDIVHTYTVCKYTYTHEYWGEV